MPREEGGFNRKMAVKCFNQAWDHLEMKERSEQDDREMLQLAHASRYHWGLVGTSTNRAVGDWLISRVYVSLGQPQLSLLFARSCLETCEGDRLTEIVHTANEAMARAYAVAGYPAKAKEYLGKARRQLAALKLSKKDRAVYLKEIEETESLIKDV
jgi:hypothetical protein